MTDNAKKFLEFASKNEAIKAEFKGAKSPEDMHKVAKTHGFELTAEDFRPSKMEELSEDEMKAVAGGSFMFCSDPGDVETHNLVCSCTEYGEGKDPDPTGHGFCVCLKLGLGWN